MISMEADRRHVGYNSGEGIIINRREGERERVIEGNK